MFEYAAGVMNRCLTIQCREEARYSVDGSSFSRHSSARRYGIAKHAWKNAIADGLMNTYALQSLSKIIQGIPAAKPLN